MPDVYFNVKAVVSELILFHKMICSPKSVSTRGVEKKPPWLVLQAYSTGIIMAKLELESLNKLTYHSMY